MPRNLSRDGWSLDPRAMCFDDDRTPIAYRIDGSVPRDLVPQLDRVDAAGDVAEMAAVGVGWRTASAGDGDDGSAETSEEGDVSFVTHEAIREWSTWACWTAASVLGLEEVMPKRAETRAVLHRTRHGVACRADVAGGTAVPYRLITFLTSHPGGAGSLVVYRHRPAAADVLLPSGPLDPAGFGLVPKHEIAAVRSRSVLFRSDLAHQLLPAASSSAFITMLVLVEDDGTAISLG